MSLPHRAHKVVASAAALALLCLLAACTSSKKPSSEGSPRPSPSALTKEEYVKQANAICEQGVGEQPPEPATAADVVNGLRTTIADLEALRSKLGRLEPPAADRKALEEQFLGVLDQQIAALKAALPEAEKAAAGGDRKAVEEVLRPVVAKIAGLDAQGAAFNGSYGLTSCPAPQG